MSITFFSFSPSVGICEVNVCKQNKLRVGLNYVAVAGSREA